MSTIRTFKKTILAAQGVSDRKLNDKQKPLNIIADVTAKKNRKKPPKIKRRKLSRQKK